MTHNALGENIGKYWRSYSRPLGWSFLSLSQFSWTDYVRLVFVDSWRRKPRKGLIKVPSDRIHRRKGEGGERGEGGNGGDFHRIKFFAASESETRDGRPWTRLPRRRWMFRRAVDQYYFVKELVRNREVGRSRHRARNPVYERYMRRRAIARVGTYIFHINDSER